MKYNLFIDKFYELIIKQNIYINNTMTRKLTIYDYKILTE
jgi:hypothetical protein